MGGGGFPPLPQGGKPTRERLTILTKNLMRWTNIPEEQKSHAGTHARPEHAQLEGWLTAVAFLSAYCWLS